MMNSKKSSRLLITSIPKVSDLQYFLGVIDPIEPRDDSVPSDFQWQVLKTRFLLWKNPEIIAAPVAKRTSHIHIIASNEFIKRGCLAKCSENHQLLLNGPYALEDYVYQECINYSVTFRLAPQWNKLEHVFVNCSHFLTSTEPMESIKLQSLISGEKLTMTVEAIRVKLPLLNLIDLGVNLTKLKSTGQAPIHQTVFILPQLKKGTAVDISTKIPSSCPFQNYSQLRRHWKNAHGYRLPHDSEGMLYLQVAFGWNPSSLYSYPVVCTRPSKMTKLKCKNDLLVIQNFARDIMRKCPTICGQPVEISLNDGDFYETISLLYPASEVPENPNYVKKSFNDEGILTQPFSLSPGKTDLPTELSSAEVDLLPFFPVTASKSDSIEPPVVSLRFAPTFTSTPALKRVQTLPGPENKPSTLNNNGKKVISSTALDEPEFKKARQDFDIETLAKSGDLWRTTVVVLSQFCKDNGIQIKSREKKEFLIQKINHFYNI